jgi:hypothetical protein
MNNLRKEFKKKKSFIINNIHNIIIMLSFKLITTFRFELYNKKAEKAILRT